MPRFFSRRRFVRLSAESLALLTVVSQAGACASAPETPARVFSPEERTALLALADTIVPPTARMPLAVGDTSLIARIEQFLAGADPLVRDQFRYLIHFFERYPQLFSLRFTRFSRLGPVARAEVLAGFAESRFYARRMAFVALKSVVCNHYFADPEVQALLGFRPVCVFS